MIDDYSVSGVNDSCVIHNKLDLHVVDTFCALIRKYFAECGKGQVDSSLLGKTYGLKNSYRQVPVDPQHSALLFCLCECLQLQEGMCRSL